MLCHLNDHEKPTKCATNELHFRAYLYAIGRIYKKQVSTHCTYSTRYKVELDSNNACSNSKVFWTSIG
jgi:hypothetical protein